MDNIEIFLWLLSIAISFMLGWFTNWDFFPTDAKSVITVAERGA